MIRFVAFSTSLKKHCTLIHIFLLSQNNLLFQRLLIIYLCSDNLQFVNAMSQKIKIFIIVFFNFLVVDSFGQIALVDGYYLTQSNDTIYGKFEYRHPSSTHNQIFIESGSNKIGFVDPNAIKGYFIFPGFSYIKKTLNGELKFFQVISKGTIDLLAYESKLYIDDHQNEPILLEEGKDLVKIGGKRYYKENYTYRRQIKQNLQDSSYFDQINELPFVKKEITRLIQKINGEELNTSKKNRSTHIVNQNIFNVRILLTANSLALKNTEYENDSLSVSYGNSGPFTQVNLYKDKLVSWGVGVDYKRMISRSNTYLGIGVKYEQLSSKSSERNGALHESILITSSGSQWADTVGTVVDRFNYHLASTSLSIAAYQEFGYSKVRPFVSLGFLNKFFLNKDVTISRKVTLRDTIIENNKSGVKIPSYMPGFLVGIGSRFLLNPRRSISLGLDIEIEKSKSYNSYLANDVYYLRSYLLSISYSL